MSETVNKKSNTLVIALCAVLCLAVIAVAVYFALSSSDESDDPTADTAATTEPADTAAPTVPAEPTVPAKPSEPVENRVEQNDNVADDIFND